jgi:hypothetical protein
MEHQRTLEMSRTLGQRVLRLIETLHRPEDISPENIERITGKPVERDPQDPRSYGFGEVLDARWIGNLVSLPDPLSDAAPERLVFSFDDQTGQYTDMSAVCGLDFDGYSEALTAAGYSRHVNSGPRDAFRSFGFSRGEVSIEVLVRGENPQNPNRLCVSSVIVDTTGVRHG